MHPRCILTFLDAVSAICIELAALLLMQYLSWQQ